MIYIHIPFCKQACHYCDFHFSTSMKYKDEMVESLLKEIDLRTQYLQDKTIHSVYFGGGTPSLLDSSEINRIMDRIAKHYAIESDAEITLEANPDDLTKDKVNQLKQTSINRFSIGIQSFFQEDLQWMNRAHNAQEARSSIMRVQDAGFENITCDLIYGFPLLSDLKWTTNMQSLVELAVPHISSYAMTVEKKTALDHLINNGKTPALDEQQSAHQMLMLIETLTAAGYEQYEISNFAKPDRLAKHNSNYWKGKQYLGIGPSAHSYNGHSRSWNIANNAQYLQCIQKNELPLETEKLTVNDRYNEYIMTSLRTKWGINLQTVAEEYGSDSLKELLKNIEPYLNNKEVVLEGDKIITLTDAGKLLADQIASALFIVD